jgi:hypothetical protein
MVVEEIDDFNLIKLFSFNFQKNIGFLAYFHTLLSALFRLSVCLSVCLSIRRRF